MKMYAADYSYVIITAIALIIYNLPTSFKCFVKLLKRSAVFYSVVGLATFVQK